MFTHDFSSYELPADIYADAIGSVVNLGDNYRTVYFVYSRGCGGVMQTVPVACIVRPKSSILVKDGAIAKMLRGEGDPRTMMIEGARLHH